MLDYLILGQGGEIPPIPFILECLYVVLGIVFAIPLMAYCRKKKIAGYAYDPLVYVVLIMAWPLWVFSSIIRISYLMIDFLSRKVEGWF